MKTAYELAMERLEKESPSGPSLTDDQKAALAEAEKQCASKIAEKKILADQEIQKNYGNPDAIAKIQEQLQQDIRILESERDQEKERIRMQDNS